MKKYDPTLFEGTAKYYAKYRVGYPEELFEHLISHFNLNKNSIVLDLGCGTGQIAFKLAPYVKKVICVDPDSDMIKEARRVAKNKKIKNVEFIQLIAEDIDKTLGRFNLVTIGAAFHWMDRSLVLDKIYNITTEHGGVAIIDSGGVPTWRPNKKVDWEVDRKEIVQKYFGETRRAGKGVFDIGNDNFEDRLQQSRFEKFSKFQCRQTIKQDIKNVLGLLYSTSFCRKDFLGDKVVDFEKEMASVFKKSFPKGFYLEKQAINALMAQKH